MVAPSTLLWVGRADRHACLLNRFAREGLRVTCVGSVAMAAAQMRAIAPDVVVLAAHENYGPLPAQVRTLSSRLGSPSNLLALAEHSYEFLPTLNAGADEVLPRDISDSRLRMRVYARIRAIAAAQQTARDNAETANLSS